MTTRQKILVAALLLYNEKGESNTTTNEIADEVGIAAEQDGAACAILGCAGMSPLKGALSSRSTVPLIDGVASAAHLASAVVADLRAGTHG